VGEVTTNDANSLQNQDADLGTVQQEMALAKRLRKARHPGRANSGQPG
jgi:hypothetical protein